MQKKNIWVYKRLQAPPYILGGYYHRERLARTRRISTRILQLGRWEDNIFEPIPEKLSTIASGANLIRSTGRAPDDNGQHWLMIKNIIDYFVNKNLRLYCRQNNIDYSHRELFTIIWRKSNSKILHTSTVKQGLQGKINDSQAKSSRRSLNSVAIKDHEGKTPGSVLFGLVYAPECTLLVTFCVYDVKKIPVDALGTLRITGTLSL
jgi:hypothetical protein